LPVKTLLITPPFTQLNTPYPATPYLTGFLKSQGYDVFQADLGIELINAIFSREGFQKLFDAITTPAIKYDKRRHAGLDASPIGYPASSIFLDSRLRTLKGTSGNDERYCQGNNQSGKKLSKNSLHIIKNQTNYIETIEQVMSFLQYRDNTLAPLLCNETFLPRASRFDSMPDLEWAFGNVGMNDKARFLATLYIEDVGDLIKDAVTPWFGFSRYAEKLGMSAHSFAPLEQALKLPENILDVLLLELLQSRLEQVCPDVVGITIPFPGNLYAGLKCAQFIKKHYPQIKIVAGGGFVNTELRDLSEPAIFDYVDFITLDDGERPFLSILDFLQSETDEEELLRNFPAPGGRGLRGGGSFCFHPPPAPTLKGTRPVKGGETTVSSMSNDGAIHCGPLLTRTFIRMDNEVRYIHDEKASDFRHAETGCPDYSDLPLDKYLSLIEMANPMHRLWSDGCWNKLTLAHGCYWHKCSFCDTSLPYIRHFESAPASVLVDRIEQMIAQTGHCGFHFVDEAAPPAVLKDVAKELLKRKMGISWWTNIRFEKMFTEDLCRLLAASGCIAVTGGLETASDRLLKLMNKGVTIRQAAQVCDHFSRAGIMVHAYLMYGFPTQTGQETIDALEIVRQFFHEGLIQSAFWHEFTATVHSDVGKNPKKYHCTIVDPPAAGFARNDLVHMDSTGCVHQDFTKGLNKAVYNFMHGIGTDMLIKDWFDFPVPTISVKRNYVKQAIKVHKY